MTIQALAILVLSLACFACSTLMWTWKSKYDREASKNRKLRTQVDSLREVVKTVKEDVDAKPKATAGKAKAVREKLDAYMIDYADFLGSLDFTKAMKVPETPPLREVPVVGAVCSAVGCGAPIDFSKAHSFKLVGAYKKGSADRVLKFMCTRCTGKRVAA